MGNIRHFRSATLARRMGVTLIWVLIVGCAGPTAHDVATTAASAAPPTTDLQLTNAYGRGPKRDAGITYQPDVIIVDGGAAAIRSVSSDGMEWTIDANAPHANELAVGKIMFLTAMATGRVLRLDRQGDAIAVTLGPVDLTEVIRDGHVSATGQLDITNLTGLVVPDLPGAGAVTTAGSPNRSGASQVSLASASGRARITLIPLADPRKLPAPTTGSTTEVTIGAFSAEVSRASNEGRLGLKVGYEKEGVTIGLDFGAILENAVWDAGLDMASGHVVNATLKITGLKRLDVKVDAGSEAGLAGNFKARIEVPVEFNIPIESPVPLNLSVRNKFLVETAFSAKNSTITAQASYAVNGPIGFSYDGTTMTTYEPSITVERPFLDSLSGVSVGANGIVAAYQLKVLIGLGIPLVSAGPFTTLTFSAGLTVGSDLGLVKCRGVTVTVVGGAGLGFTLASSESDALKAILKGLHLEESKVDSEFASVSKELFKGSQTIPKVKVCQ